WNGLNGRARWPSPLDGGARWREHFAHQMRPWQLPKRDGYALILGQMPTDTACSHVPYQLWLNDVARSLMLKGREVCCRAHPQTMHVVCPVRNTPESNSLEQDLDGAAFAVTFNSNSGVNAVMRGVRTITMDEGSMAWDITSHELDEELVTP